MICSVCHKETTAVRVGTGDYCRECGARLTPNHVTVPSKTAGARSMDLRPSRTENPAAPPPRAQSAAALHARATTATGHVLDLREAKPIKRSAAPRSGSRPAKVEPTTPTVTKKAHPAASTAQMAHQREEAVAQPLSHVRSAPEPAPAPKTAAKQRFKRFEDRFKEAQNIPRSQHISKFGQVFTTESATESAATTTSALVTSDSRRPESKLPELPAAIATQHQAMARLARSNEHATPPNAKRFGIAPSAGQYAATAAAVAIMGGYIWLQNYPKLAIQSAGNKAGIEASMPGYVPTSYSLANTKTGPGLVTLNFSSASQSGGLTIAQQHTSWDSSSLLDNFVNHKSAEYTAVEGQGLTIYLYGQNQATWVNHGIWYQIEGATRLSREQILKIAYSL